ncbi:MAG: hypothetical protein ABW134_11805 [Candidatus Thiodiazotropha endolucinida]
MTSLSLSTYYASKKDPDKHARHLFLADSQNLPVETVERNSQEVEQRQRLKSLDLSTYTETNPGLTRYLSNKHNAAVSIDDIDPLKGIEDTLQDRTWLEAISDVGLDLFGVGSINVGESVVGISDLVSGSIYHSLIDMSGLTAADKLIGTDYTDQLKDQLSQYTAGNYLGKLGYDPEQSKQFIQNLQSKQKQQADARVARAKGFFDTLGALADNPSALVGTVAQSTLSMLGPAAATRGYAMYLLTKNGLKAGSKEAAEFFAKKEVIAKLASVSAVSEGAVAAGSTMEQGRQEDVPYKRRMATSLGTLATTAGISKFTSKFLPDVETQVATAGSKKQTLMEGLKDIAKGTVKEGVLEEMPQSGFEQIWSNIAQEKPLLEGVGAAMATGLVTGSAMGGGMSTASTTINALSRTADETMERVLESVNDQQKIDSLVAYAQSSKTEERSPAQWKEYLHEVAGDKKVYLSAQAATSIPNLPSSIVDQINATGTDIDIPIETFATEIIQDPVILEAMRPHLKMSEDGLTAAEIEEGNFTELQSLVGRAVKNQVELSEAQKIFEEVKDQLIATDRMSESTARTAAKIIPAYVTTAAKRYGRSVADVYEKMGLRVVGPDFQVDDIKKTMHQDRINKVKSLLDCLGG